MSAKRSSVRTWIELDQKALHHNYQTFRKLVGPQVKLFAVIKSNAYGHGLFDIAKLLARTEVDGFCVDSIVEGIALRKAGIRKPILILGPTLPEMLGEARARRMTVSVSNFEALTALTRMKNPPEFHLKIDTGMHRQGFYPGQIAEVIRILDDLPARRKLAGVYTHFAAATRKNSVPTERQYRLLLEVKGKFIEAGYQNLLFHASATGGTVLNKKYHLDMVRVGKGMYGFLPSPEMERIAKLGLRPVLSWRTLISEVKEVPAGARIGYDLTEKVKRRTRMAILPIGYWHGFPRALSSVGEVLIRGKRAKVLGRVSMDLLAVDATGIKVKVGDQVTLLGRSGRKELRAPEVAKKAGTVAYELLTRLNPLIQKIVVE